MANNGGPAVFGDWKDWGCPFDMLHMQEKWQPLTFESEQQFMRALKNNGMGLIGNMSSTVAHVQEHVDLQALCKHAATGTDRRQELLELYIRRHHEHGPLAGASSSIDVENYQQKHYGRYLARGPAGQKLTKEARAIALGAHSAVVDPSCCHPRLLRKRLEDCKIWDAQRFPMIQTS